MGANAVSFPAFLRLEYDGNQSAGRSMLADLDRALSNAEGRFREFSSNAQRQLDQALSIKRNDLGSLDLGVEEMRASAAAMDARAAAAREVANATRIAAKEEGDYGRQARLAIAATEALAVEEERAARTARAHADAAEQVQAVLNRQASATDMVVQSQRRGTSSTEMVVNSQRSQRFAFIQANQQLQDMAIQMQMGTRVSTIFAQQVPQLGFALSGISRDAKGLTGALGAFGRFMTGGWGTAIAIGAVALSPLIDSLFKTSKETDKSKKNLESFSDSLDLSKHSMEEATQALREYNAQQAKSRELTVQSAQAAADLAAKAIKAAIATRQQLQVELERAQVNAKYNAGQGTGGVAGSFAAGQLVGVQGQMNANAAALKMLSDDARAAVVNVADEVAKMNADPTTRIRAGFDKLRQDARSTVKDVSALTARLTDLNRQEKVAIEAIGASKKAAGARDMAEFGRPVASGQITSGYGTRSRPTAGASTNHLGIDYAVPIGTPVLAAMDGIVRFAHAVNGYGNQIELTHGGGTASRYSHLSRFAVNDGQQVSKGDVIGYSGKTGIATGPHLHYEVLVNGKKVDPTKGRFPIDSTVVAAEAERAADSLNEFGQRASDSIARISERFDEQPKLIDQAAAATRDLDAIMADLEQRKPVGWRDMIKDAEATKAVVESALLRPFEAIREESERRVEIERLLTAGREDEANALQIIWQLENQIGSEAELHAKAAALAAVGRKDEAAALERLAAMWPEQRQAIRDQVALEHQKTDEMRRQQELVGAYLDATRSVKQELVSIFSGTGSLGNLQQTFKNLWSQVTVEKLFGPALRDLEKWVKNGGADDPVDVFASETQRAGKAAMDFADTLNGVTARIANPAGAVRASVAGEYERFLDQFDTTFRRASNDNADSTGEIVVTAMRGSVLGLSPDAYFAQMAETMGKPLARAIDGLFGGSLGSALGHTLSGGMYGYSTAGTPGLILGGLQGLVQDFGQGLFGRNTANDMSALLGSGLQGAQGGGLLASLAGSFGIGLNGTGAQIGGALGSLIPGGDIIGSLIGGIIGGKNLPKAIGGGLGGVGGYLAGSALGSSLGAIGAVGGPIGAVVGALLGSLVGGLFGKRPRGASEVTNTSNYAHTNDSGLTSNLTDFGGTVQTAIQRVADALGASVGNYSIGLGRYRDYYQVSTQAGDPRLGNSYFGRDSRNAVYDGLDAQAALTAAIGAAIQQGAIAGLHAGSQQLLKKYAGDLDAAIQKVVDFEGVFKKLRQYKDPIGAALDDLNKEFEKLKVTFTEAGASTAEFAQLEELYGIRRAEAIKQATEQMTGSLKGLLDELTVGNDALSLRDRKAMALATYQPLAARVQAGDVTAFSDYADAARVLLDVERQMSGSQSGYFDLWNQVTSLSRTALDGQQALIDQATGSNSPFARNAISANDNQGVVDAVNGQTSALNTTLNSQLNAVNQNLAQIGNLLVSGGDYRAVANKLYF